jgi:hypothetical protein
MSVAEIERKPRAKIANDVSSVPHVIRAINEVTATLASEGISKDRKNTQQSYQFRGIDDVLNALSRIISNTKLVIVPHVLSRDLVERQTKTGGALFYVTVRVEYTFISAEDGSRETIGPFDGEAMDSADKATNKAMSAAYKYMAIQTFCIPTEGDNDADATTHEVAPSQQDGPTEAELTAFFARAQSSLNAKDTPDQIEAAWEKISKHPCWPYLDERDPRSANKLRTLKTTRMDAVSPNGLNDEIPF